MRKLFILILSPVFIIYFTGCTSLFKCISDDNNKEKKVIVKYEDWCTERVSKKTKSSFSKLKMNGKIKITRPNSKSATMQFGLLLKDNGDEALGLYKGMTLLLKYQLENNEIQLEPANNDIMPDTKLILPLIIGEIRDIFLPADKLTKKLESEKTIGNSFRIQFAPEILERTEESIILTKYMSFYFDELKEIKFFNETEASNYISIKFSHYSTSNLFKYPETINVKYFPLNLELNFQVKEFTYL
ncbi:hypothetical protein KAU33_14890 [Candidatus Dependentiae bacterium]|nr:hypothetical protein [Candidatus Dependentiae bacterium]